MNTPSTDPAHDHQPKPLVLPYGSIARAIQTAQVKIEALARLGEALREIDAACALPDGIGVYVEAAYIALHVPFDRPTISATRRALGQRLKRVRCQVASDGDVCWNCTWRMNDGSTVPVTVWLMAEIKGATCQRVKVGEKVQPVFQVVCQ